jgi:hypothetical protein
LVPPSRACSGPFVARVLPLVLAVAWSAPAQSAPAPAPVTWTVEARLGAPVIPDRRVTITQSGQPDLAFDAHFDAATTATPYHYDFRIARRTGDDGWALDFLHSKLTLTNGPAEVTDLQLTHGYNLLTVQRLWHRRGFDLMAGAGVALAHAESTVRGQVFAQDGGLFGWGYHAVAPVVTVGVGRRVEVGRGMFLSAEARGSLSRAVVPVAGGKARFTDLEGHFLAGAGARF